MAVVFFATDTQGTTRTTPKSPSALEQTLPFVCKSEEACVNGKENSLMDARSLGNIRRLLHAERCCWRVHTDPGVRSH